MSLVFVVNHIYPDERRRELIRSSDLDELRKWAKHELDDRILTEMFDELAEWRAEA